MTTTQIIHQYLKEQGYKTTLDYSYTQHQAIHTTGPLTRNKAITVDGSWCKVRWVWINIINNEVQITASATNTPKPHYAHNQNRPTISLELQDPNFFNKLEHYMPKQLSLLGSILIPYYRLWGTNWPAYYWPSSK